MRHVYGLGRKVQHVYTFQFTVEEVNGFRITVLHVNVYYEILNLHEYIDEGC